MTAIDASGSMIAAAHDRDPDGRYLVGSGDRLPFRDAVFDIVVTYNALMDVDDMPERSPRPPGCSTPADGCAHAQRIR